MSTNYGLMLQVPGSDELLAAARASRSHGIVPLDAFSPFPVEGLSEVLEIPPSRIPWIMLWSGVTGAIIAFGTMTFSAVWHYPFIVGGRPLFSWPSFVPVTFELTILFSALGGAFSLAMLSRLPQLHHPVFNDRRFRESMQGGFFLLLADSVAAREFLNVHYPTSWEEVQR